MQSAENFLGHFLDPVQDLRYPRIGGPCFLFLLFGQRQRAQREQFIDLRRIVHVAGTLRSNFRVVVEQYRGRQHEVVRSRFTYAHRERVDVLAPRDERSSPRSGLYQRGKSQSMTT